MSLTVWDLALADGPLDHIARSRAWAEALWKSWSAHHDGVAAFVDHHLRPHA